MPSEFTLDIGGQVTPEDKGGPRVGIGGKVLCSRDSPGAIGIQILRGDGGNPESFEINVRTKILGPFEAGVAEMVDIGALDLPAFQSDGFSPRAYRMRVVADDGAELTVVVGSGFLATEPYAPAGSGP